MTCMQPSVCRVLMSEIGWAARIQSYKRTSLHGIIRAGFEPPRKSDLWDLKIEHASSDVFQLVPPARGAVLGDTAMDSVALI